MGAVILVVGLVIEVALAAYCVVTRSSQRKVRGLVRVGAFAAFVLLALASVVEWGFRWYGLAALLAVWAVLGARTLLQRRARTERYGPGRVLLGAVGTLALLSVVLAPALVFPQHRLPKTTGPHRVATVEYTYTDEGRVETYAQTGEKRKVNVQFWYPSDDDAKYPLVAFSHGSFGMKTGNESTFVELASNGYVLCAIDHPYQSLFTKSDDGRLTTLDPTFRQELFDLNADRYDDETELQITRKWMSVRTADIDLALDTILQRAKDADAGDVYRRVDTANKIGLIGHSLGGAASAQLGRERGDVGAVVNLDGDLLGEYLGVADGKPILNDEVYPVPLLSIYTDDMAKLFTAKADPTATIPGKRIAATAPAAFETHIVGTVHMSLTDVPLLAPALVTLMGDPKGLNNEAKADPYHVVETMNGKVLEFFDAYLKGKGRFAVAETY